MVHDTSLNGLCQPRRVLGPITARPVELEARPFLRPIIRQGKISRCCLPAHGFAVRALETGFPALNPATLQQRRRTRHDVVFGMQARCHGICRSRALLRILLKIFAPPCSSAVLPTKTDMLVWRPPRQPRLFRPGVVWGRTVYPETKMTLSSQKKNHRPRTFGNASSRSAASPGRRFLLPRGLFSRSIRARGAGVCYNGSGALDKLEAGQNLGRGPAASGQRPAWSCVAGWGDACDGHACMRDGSTFVSLVLAACHLAR